MTVFIDFAEKKWSEGLASDRELLTAGQMSRTGARVVPARVFGAVK